MSENLLTTLIEQRKLRQAYDYIQKMEIENKGEGINDGFLFRKLQILYQRGNLEEIRNLCNDELAQLSLNNYKMEFILNIFLGISEFELRDIDKGNIAFTKAGELLTYAENTKIEESILTLYKFVNGLFLEVQGKFKEAKWKYLEILDDQPILELNFVYYHLGICYRYTGEIEQSLQSFFNSLKYTLDQSSLEFEANLKNFIGENKILLNDFETCVDDINAALKDWEQLDSPYGISWALYDLYCLYFHLDNYSKALEYLIKLFDLAKHKMNPVPLSDILLQLIIISVMTKNTETARLYNSKLEKLAAENSTRIIHERMDLAQATINSIDTRISVVFSNLKNITDITENSEFVVEKLSALLLYVNFLQIELNLLKEKNVPGELREQIKGTSDKILEQIILSESLTIFNLCTKIRYLLKNLPEDVIQLGKTKLNKEISTYARLSFMLFLVGKRNVSFSQIVDATELSSGTINSVARSLEKLSYITVKKIFEKVRFVTVYNLTTLGLYQIENFGNQIKSRFHS